MNPYASYLGERKAEEAIAATAGELQRTMSRLSAEQLDRAPAPGKWSIRQIVCHLADCEIVFAYRIRQTLAEAHHVIQPFDQDTWADVYSAYSAEAALAVFTAVRNWNVALIATLSPEAMAKPVSHPERGTMTLRTIVETMGGHDRNHLEQVEAILAKAASA